MIDPLYVASGFAVGVLVGMTGVGGGSLMTPLLILLFGIHPSTAVGTDLLYAAATKTGGSLQGDSAAVNLRAQLRATLRGNSTASTMFTRLADIGFDVKQDGSITLDNSKLDNALANLGELKKLFSASDTLVPANNGFATLFRQQADQAIGVEGSIASRSEGLRERISRNEKRQAELEVRVAQTEARLRKQYTALDAQMGQLQSLSTYVTQQMSILSNSSK